MTPSYHGGNPWPLLAAGSFPPEEILDFSADLNPLGPPSNLPELLAASGEKVRWYPEPTYSELRRALGRWKGIDPSTLLVGNGTADLIHLVSRWQRGGRAVVLVPTFTEYERALLADGAQVIPWHLQEDSLFSPPSLNGCAPWAGAKILFLCNPNNPTGTLWTRQRILPLIERCEEEGIGVVVDEAYMDLVDEPLSASLLTEVSRFHRLIVLESLTKTFAVPGLRIGYLAASGQVISELSAIQPPWSVNALAADVGTRLIEEKQYLARSPEALATFRRLLWEGLKALPGLEPVPSAANFFLCRITHPHWTNAAVADELSGQGILIRCCDDFTGLERGRFIRVAVRQPDENSRLLQALGEIFSRAR